VPSKAGFDFSRPLSGNAQMYKFAFRAIRAGASSGPKPYRLATWIRRLWMPLDIIGVIGLTFFGQPPLFLDWAIAAGIAPRFVFEFAAWVHLLPSGFFGRPITKSVIILEVFILTYLVALGLGLTILLWAAPAVLIFFFWRVARKTGGIVKTLALIYRVAVGAAVAQAAAESATVTGVPAPAPPRRIRVVSRSAGAAPIADPQEKLP
jgi:hypothetical protein